MLGRSEIIGYKRLVLHIHSHLAGAWPGSGRRSGEKTPPPFFSLLWSLHLFTGLILFLRYVRRREQEGKSVFSSSDFFLRPGPLFFPSRGPFSLMLLLLLPSTLRVGASRPKLFFSSFLSPPSLKKVSSGDVGGQFSPVQYSGMG